MADAFCVVILSEVEGSIESPYYYKFYCVFKIFYFIYIKGVKNEIFGDVIMDPIV
jgi:cyanate lyase